MVEQRLQVLLDESRGRRLSAYVTERNLSIGAVVREAIDRTIPASRDERRAARRILGAEPMPVPPPSELREELEGVRGRAG